jgi:hypothetical protein
MKKETVICLNNPKSCVFCGKIDHVCGQENKKCYYGVIRTVEIKEKPFKKALRIASYFLIGLFLVIILGIVIFLCTSNIQLIRKNNELIVKDSINQESLANKQKQIDYWKGIVYDICDTKKIEQTKKYKEAKNDNR